MEQNALAKFHNRDLRKSIQNLTVVQGTAKESGNIYYAVELTFINGYKKRIFLRSDEQFAWVNAFEQAETEEQIEL